MSIAGGLCRNGWFISQVYDLEMDYMLEEFHLYLYLYLIIFISQQVMGST